MYYDSLKILQTYKNNIKNFRQTQKQHSLTIMLQLYKVLSIKCRCFYKNTLIIINEKTNTLRRLRQTLRCKNYYIIPLQAVQVKIWELLPELPEKILLQIWIARMNLYKKPEKPQINMAVQELCGKALNRSAEPQKVRYNILQDMQQIP